MLFEQIIRDISTSAIPGRPWHMLFGVETWNVNGRSVHIQLSRRGLTARIPSAQARRGKVLLAACAAALLSWCSRTMPVGPAGTMGGSGRSMLLTDGPEPRSNGATALVDAVSPQPQEPTYFKASNTGGPSAGERTGDHFGFHVTLSGDTLAVGAPREDSGATGVNGSETDKSIRDSGAVYIFRRAGATWIEEAYLKASNPGPHAQFGAALALSGGTLAVGAFGEDSSATGVNGNQTDHGARASGAVYMFTRAGTTWTQQAYLKASNAGGIDWFGHSVALSGDTLAVGAPGEDSGATGINGNQTDNGAEDSGAVYVFTRTGTTWTQQAYLKASNTSKFDRFGYSIALSGDTLGVGAHAESSSATGVNGNQANNKAPGSGAVYVFTRAGSLWAQQAYVKASNAGGDDRFGFSVALLRDTLVAGAPGEDSSATGINGNQIDESAHDSGAAYVFKRAGGSWTQQAYLKASNTGADDRFGFSVALWDDRVAVGAPSESSAATGMNGNQLNQGAQQSGAAYVFERTGATWSQTLYVKASNTDALDEFGSSVALSDYGLAVGAPREDSGATGLNGNQWDNSALDSGAVYLFRR